MSLFLSLFGGALLIFVIYYLLRAFGVSNYWRGVISGVIPVAAYLAWSISHWPGGDVVSMHMAVFLATATVLTLIGGRKPGTGKPLHWGPKIIIGFFLILFVIDGSLLMISGQGVPPLVAKWLLPPGKNSAHPTTHTAFSGVVSHGEEAAKTINQFMSNAEKQRKLGWEIAIVGLDELRQGSPSTVSVTAHDTNARALQGAQVKVAIARPGLVQPAQLLELHETDPGVYRGTLTMELPGVWVLAVQLQRGKDLFEQQQHISVSAAR